MSLPPLPNLVIAGAAKAGTTSLFRYLGQHPDICPSIVKEIGHFASTNAGGPPPDPAAYAGYFCNADGERYRLEASPGYLSGGEPVAAAVRGTLDESRIIVSLRDPAPRVLSSFRYLRSRMVIDQGMSFDEYVDRCLRVRDRGEDRDPRLRAYWTVSTGFYGEHLGHWQRIFDDRLRVVFFEDLATDPRAVVAGICAWLDVDTDVAGAFRYGVENRTVLPRNTTLQRAALKLNRTTLLSRNPRVKAPFRAAYYAVNGRTDAGVGERERATIELLRGLYAQANADLAEQLRARGCTALPAWLQPAEVPSAPGSEERRG